LPYLARVYRGSCKELEKEYEEKKDEVIKKLLRQAIDPDFLFSSS